MSVLICENLVKNNRSENIIKDFSYNFLENQIYALVEKNEYYQHELLNLICGKMTKKNMVINA